MPWYLKEAEKLGSKEIGLASLKPELNSLNPEFSTLVDHRTLFLRRSARSRFWEQCFDPRRLEPRHLDQKDLNSDPGSSIG